VEIAKAAIASGAARHEITDFEKYRGELQNRLSQNK
jgi:hypothetical protein